MESENVIIFGCSKKGTECLKKICLEDKQNILFCDNDPKKWNTECMGMKVCSFEQICELGDNYKIIIASSYWREIYEQCVKSGIIVDLFFDGEKFCTYKEMCKEYLNYYSNCAYVKWENGINIRCNELVKNFKSGRTLENNLNRVSIMLSNLCNYAYIHPQCPASCITEKEILDASTVNRIIDELVVVGFNGTICFHIYNEPMMDPRLFYFIKIVREKLVDADILIYSNGYYLNQTMVNELIDIGTSVLVVTAYGKKENNRLIDLDVSIPYHVLFGVLDERMDNYDPYTPEKNTVKVCRSLISELCIYSNGDIGLCCLDYKHPYSLGNIKEASLSNILKSEKINSVVKKLLENQRELPICKRCGWSR